ncbi:MAG: hypothetical protein R3A78_16375 [Polyangiales bacterium]
MADHDFLNLEGDNGRALWNSLPKTSEYVRRIAILELDLFEPRVALMRFA